MELPEVGYDDVSVQWEADGDIVSAGSVVIPEGSLSADFMIAIPDDSQMTNGGTATISLTAVDNGLSLGRPNVASSIISTVVQWTDND